VPAAKKPAAPTKKRFGNWVVVRQFDDDSGFGDIYEVKDAQNKLKRAVVKTIKYDHKPEHYPKLLKMFHQEAVILSNLKHENICGFIEANFESNEPWFAMNLYRGNNILQDLIQYGPAPEEIWFDRARDILKGLAYAHSEDVMHGDLNPKNVIIDGRGAKLIDFGIARLIDPNSNHRTNLAYAEGWQSPEHARKIPMLQSDIFVLASLLTFFGTGQYPFQPDDTGDHQDSIDNEEPNYSNLSTNQKLLLKPMHEKSPQARISAEGALALLEKLRPSAGARPIVPPAKNPMPAASAKKPPVKVPVKAKNVGQQVRAEAQKVPPGIELLRNGARVAGWKAKETPKAREKRSTLSDMPASYWLLIASILTLGLALIPYWFVSRFSKNTKHLDERIRVRLGISLAVYFLSFGMFAPFVTLWWARRIGFLHLKTILVVQSLTSFLIFAGTVAESGQSPSGFLWLVRIVGLFTCLWSYSVIKEKLGAKPVIEERTKKERRAETAGEVTGGHQSWEEVKATFKSAVSTRHGKRFIIEILSAEYQGIYFQGYSEPDGAWTIEAAADLSVRPHLTEDKKVKMSMIGWELPSEGLPNFIMFLEADESDDDDISEIFTKSLRDGYGLSITKFRVMAKAR
jgi:serine/threonine protein kinase